MLQLFHQQCDFTGARFTKRFKTYRILSLKLLLISVEICLIHIHKMSYFSPNIRTKLMIDLTKNGERVYVRAKNNKILPKTGFELGSPGQKTT